MTTKQTHQPDEKTLSLIREFEAAIARNPDDADAYATMGLWWHRRGDHSKALDHYNAAIHLAPSFARALCARASLLATCPDPRYRDGGSAVRDATAALAAARKNGELYSNSRNLMYLQTLAAAHAEHGDFNEAMRFQQEALGYTDTLSMEDHRKVISRLMGFHSRRPVRERSGLV